MTALFAIALTFAAPAVAPVGQPVERPVSASDSQLMAELALINRSDGDASRLEVVERLLRQPGRPARHQAILEFLRAGALFQLPGRVEEAKRAVAKSLRLEPVNAPALLLSSEIQTYYGDPVVAANQWVEGSRLAPDVALQSSVYSLNALIGRLSDKARPDIVAALVARMVALDHPAATTEVRSKAAVARATDRVKTGNPPGAEQAMRDVVDFGGFLEMYLDRRFQPIWPAMERWIGGDLQRQRDASLRGHRADWRRNGLTSAPDYAFELAAAGADQAVVDLFLKTVRSPAEEDDPHQLARLASIVARTLLNLGRRDEALALLSRYSERMDEDDASPALTARANLAAMQLRLGRFAEARATVNRFVEDFEALNGSGNQGALLQTSMIAICAKFADGDSRARTQAREAAERLMADAPSSVRWAWVQCSRDTTGAWQLLTGSLSDEANRSWALSELQPTAETPTASDWDAEGERFLTTLRQDAELIAAANRVGRILPKPWPRRLPPDFDPAG